MSGSYCLFQAILFQNHSIMWELRSCLLRNNTLHRKVENHAQVVNYGHFMNFWIDALMYMQ